jgi:hypothetical protein
MTEAFISFLWKHRYLKQDLRTTSGDALSVLHPGEQNTDSGPDFFNARLRIGTTTWAGNVEIHVRASDWYKHGHHHDAAYDRAILHVVYEADCQVYHQNGEPFQTLVIRNHFPELIFDRYKQMMQNQQWIACVNQIQPEKDYGFTMWAPGLVLERLEQKSKIIGQLFKSSDNDWDEAFYRHLAGSFGSKINSLAFELLAKSLPIRIVRHHCNSIFQMEALLFGQAGMLDRNFNDQYPRELVQEYNFLRAKHLLVPVSGSIWKFLRLRPGNFPTVRISQLAGFLCRTQGKFFTLLENGSLDNLRNIPDITASEYWTTHYVFDKQSAPVRKIMGASGLNLMIINGILPFLFFYGLEKSQSSVCEDVMRVLEQTGGECNRDVDRWKEVGFPVGNAIQTQALYQLKRFYCDKKRCLACRIGSRLLAGQD